MHKLKMLTCAIAATGVLALAPVSAQTPDNPRTDVMQARTEGSIATAFALNRHLNSDRIQVEMQGRMAILTGTVENGVNRELAEQVALSIEGVDEVNNQLNVNSDTNQSDAERTSLANSLNDVTTSATIKSKLLWNRYTQGLDIDVNTQNNVVTLSGKSDREAGSELAERLAGNTQGVREVRNQIEITGQAGTAERAQQAASVAADEAADVVSDAWITSKVKSSLIFSRNLDGMDISVMSRNGQVTLGGRVDSAASKELAVETARNVRSVKNVDAREIRIAP
jgi:osmotically-inducible protein OsmY